MTPRPPSRAGILLGLALGAAGAATAAGAAGPADLILVNGKVLTVDPGFRQVAALAVKDGRIEALGTNEEIRRMAGAGTRVIDAGGRTVVPGILESHVHPGGVVRGEAEHPYRQLSSIAEIQDWVRQRVADSPGQGWIRIPRVDVTRIRERRLPTGAELDAASPTRPVVFTWQYANRIVQILNRPARTAAGITRATEPFPGGSIDHDAAGEPDGRMENCSGLVARFLHARGLSPAELDDGLQRLFHRYNEIGITSITDRLTDRAGYENYVAMEHAGRLSVRVTVTIALSTDGTVAGTERFIRSLPFKTGDGDDWVRVGPLKIGVDGGSLYGTAYLRRPYGPAAFPLYGFKDPNYRGDLRLSPEKIKNLIRTGHRLGWQMASHVTGDAGVDAVLDAVEAANADHPIAPRRYNLIHAYFSDPATARRAARLGVVLDTQPDYYFKDSDALVPALGRDMVDRYIDVKTWADNGVKVVINSDHMLGFEPDSSTNPYNPFLAMQTVVTGKSEGGHVYGAGRQVSRQDALRMMTINAAWMSFDEHRKGSLEVGKLADFAVLTGDYLHCPADRIKALRAQVTVVGGEVVFDRASPADAAKSPRTPDR